MVRVADFTNPDLKPWAKAIMRRANENALAGGIGYPSGAVRELVGIERGEVSGVINLE